VAPESLPTQGVVATAFGGPEVLRYQPLVARRPGPGEVRIRQTAVGVNYIDIYVRSGLYRMIEPPAPLGMEAAGVVVDAGDGVAHLLPGDRVAYACAPVGAYVGVRTMPADQVVVLPDDVDDETAAMLMLKGMTAAYLLHRTHRVRAGETVLVHAAAGGVGLLLCQWARALGARVIGTVSSEDKARIARANGCELPLVARDYRFAPAVKAATRGRGADVIYDGLGRAAMEENLDALALCGHWVSYGQASGPLSPITPETLAQKSVTLSRPVLFHYTAEPAALNEIAQQAFEALRRGVIRVEGRHRYPLAAAAEAHRDLEGRRTTGPLVLLP
jgi:NADPH:quinone reductase-like Zn-dependent oxidoreductase